MTPLQSPGTKVQDTPHPALEVDHLKDFKSNFKMLLSQFRFYIGAVWGKPVSFYLLDLG